jgi:hypothetical protein
LERQTFPCGPADKIREQIAMVGQIVAAESAVEIGGQEGHATAVGGVIDD